jgi:hypothetical protein
MASTFSGLPAARRRSQYCSHGLLRTASRTTIQSALRRQKRCPTESLGCPRRSAFPLIAAAVVLRHPRHCTGARKHAGSSSSAIRQAAVNGPTPSLTSPPSWSWQMRRVRCETPDSGCSSCAARVYLTSALIQPGSPLRRRSEWSRSLREHVCHPPWADTNAPSCRLHDISSTNAAITCRPTASADPGHRGRAHAEGKMRIVAQRTVPLRNSTFLPS